MAVQVTRLTHNIAQSYRLRLKRDGTRAETRFRLSTKRTSPFKSAGASVLLTTGSRGVSISGSNAGYTTFRGSGKSTGYPLHSPVSPSLPLPCVTVCHHVSNAVYYTPFAALGTFFETLDVPLTLYTLWTKNTNFSVERLWVSIALFVLLPHYIVFIISSCVTQCFSDRASWIDHTIITNVMHWILFIRKILLLSSTCFEYQVLIFRRT